MEQAPDAGAHQRVDLVACGAITYEAVRVDVDGGAGEQLAQREGRVDLHGLDGELDVVVAEVPQQPQVPLPERDVVGARAPAAGVERGDRLVPGEDLVEPLAQSVETGHRVDPGRDLGVGRVVGDQQHPAVGCFEEPGVEGCGQRGGAVQRRRTEDLGGAGLLAGGHQTDTVPADAETGLRRTFRRRLARWASIESMASARTSCGIRFNAAALSERSFRATAGSNLSIAPR